jgi:predicted nucleic acid-binding protein
VRVVIDANIAVQIALAGDLGPLGGHDLVAPPLLRAEALSSISEMTFRGEIPPDAGRAAILRAAAIEIDVHRPDTLDARAWDIARSLGWAKTYDAEYVALALIHGIPLITLDARLRRGAGHLVSMPLVTELD